VPASAIVHEPAREESELRAYLGPEYRHLDLQQSDARLHEEFHETADEDRFYRSSQAYLYNLTAFAMTPTKLPYLRMLTERLAPGSRVLDYGCGIGSDGLMLLEAGYRVEFADFDNPSVEYLRWRLQRRGLQAPIHDLDRDVPSGFDAAYSFDVIEHVDDPFGFVTELERRAALVAVNLLEPTPDDQDLHRELPIGGLLARATARELLGYRVFYGRSHLLIYRPSRSRRFAGMRGRLRIAAAGLRRRLDARRPAADGAA
jgi:SAM-dependent methyltransferase